MKFIGVPVRVRESNNPFFTPKGTLPVMRDGRTVLTNFEQVVDYLKSLVRNNYYKTTLLGIQLFRVTRSRSFLRFNNISSALQHRCALKYKAVSGGQCFHSIPS